VPDNNLNPINGVYNGYGQVYNQMAVDAIRSAPVARMAFQNPNKQPHAGDRNGEPGSVIRPLPAYVDPSMRQAPGPQGAIGRSDPTWTSYDYSSGAPTGSVTTSTWQRPDPSQGPQATGVGPASAYRPAWSGQWNGPGIGSGGLPTPQLGTGAQDGTVDRPSTYAAPTGFGSAYGGPIGRLPLVGAQRAGADADATVARAHAAGLTCRSPSTRRQTSRN
jgi:hypothetical protein